MTKPAHTLSTLCLLGLTSLLGCQTDKQPGDMGQNVYEDTGMDMEVDTGMETDTGTEADTGIEVDMDDDGFVESEDCDDNDPTLGAIGRDADCDGTFFDDDCDDNDPMVYPGAIEILDDGTDQDCNGHDAITCVGDIEYEYAEHCAVITGDLWIEGSRAEHAWLLHTLQVVGGHLKVRSNDTLQSLQGMSNLTTVGGHLHLYENAALTHIDDLSNLTSVGGYLNINVNDNLRDIDGLSSLTSVGGFLQIEQNVVLDNVDGLSSLASVEGMLSIQNNEALINVDGLSSLVHVGVGFWIYNNPVLDNIDGLSNLSSVGGYKIWNNASLCQSQVELFEASMRARGWSGAVATYDNDESC